MALVLKRIYTGYFWVFNELADSRAEKCFFLSTPLIPFTIVMSYYYFVYDIGPKFMKNRRPLQLKTFLVFYNLSQIILNVTLLFKGGLLLNGMNYRCNPIDYSQSPRAEELMRTVYYYHILKIYDLMDTVLMIVKKNSRQLSFLHVYHHSGMVMATFIAAKFLGGGDVIWTGLINLSIHSIMYSYYLLTVLDEKWKQSVSFKKFLTSLQLVQFAANIFVYGRHLFMPDCSFPRIVPYLYIPQNMFMLALFGDFYIKTYILKKPKEAKPK